LAEVTSRAQEGRNWRKCILEILRSFVTKGGRETGIAPKVGQKVKKWIWILKEQ
jgi:hypothetical protein